jgi:hypothetical protein
MKPSTALLRGAKGREQLFGEYYNEDKTACCALGALSLGADVSCSTLTLKAKFPELRQIRSYEGVDITGEIIHLNDVKKWSFKQIAAWLKRQGM